MTLYAPLCRINKGQKSMPLLGLKIWNMLNSSIKTAPTTAFFSSKFAKKTNSRRITILLILLILLIIYYFPLLYIFALKGDPNGNKNCFGSFLAHPDIFDQEVFFCLFFSF